MPTHRLTHAHRGRRFPLAQERTVTQATFLVPPAGRGNFRIIPITVIPSGLSACPLRWVGRITGDSTLSTVIMRDSTPLVESWSSEKLPQTLELGGGVP